MEEKEKVAQQQAEAKQSSVEATPKKDWSHIDYSKYKIPEGNTVEKAHLYPLAKKEGEKANDGYTHGLSAVINGEQKHARLFKNDVEAYFEKNSNGELTKRATLDQLVAKYFFPQKAVKEDYSKYAMPENVKVENANVTKKEGGKGYIVRADIDGKTLRAPLTKEDVSAFFDKDKDGNRRATAEQLVGKYFNFKSEHFYEKFKMPEGAEMSKASVFKAADTGKMMVEATVNGEKMKPAELTPQELNAYIGKKSNGERIATAEQLAAKHFAPVIIQQMKDARNLAFAAAKDAVLMRTLDSGAKSFNADQAEAVNKALGDTDKQRTANAAKLIEAVKPVVEAEAEKNKSISPAWLNATANEVKAIAADYEKYKSEQSQSVGISR